MRTRKKGTVLNWPQIVSKDEARMVSEIISSGNTWDCRMFRSWEQKVWSRGKEKEEEREQLAEGLTRKNYQGAVTEAEGKSMHVDYCSGVIVDIGISEGLVVRTVDSAITAV